MRLSKIFTCPVATPVFVLFTNASNLADYVLYFRTGTNEHMKNSRKFKGCILFWNDLTVWWYHPRDSPRLFIILYLIAVAHQSRAKYGVFLSWMAMIGSCFSNFNEAMRHVRRRGQRYQSTRKTFWPATHFFEGKVLCLRRVKQSFDPFLGSRMAKGYGCPILLTACRIDVLVHL